MAEQQVILITGASSGIGKAAALRLLADGHTVYGAARSVERMLDVSENGGHVLAMDVTDEASVNACVARVIQEQGRIDVLVNNAGYGLFGAIEDVTLKDARAQFEVNLFGLAVVTKAVLPHMRSARSGTIINMSSMGGRMYTPLGAWYHATKYALEAWSDCLRIEVDEFGIRVVIIEPGIINTAFGDVFLGPMLERSGTGPYANMAAALADETRNSYLRKSGSPPSVVADAIARAAGAKRPRTRYIAGKYARLLICARRFLGDRLYDRLLLGRMRRR